MSVSNDKHSGPQVASNNRVGIERHAGPFFVGVTGGTGAGKTTFCRRLAKILAAGRTVTLVDLDSYHKDLSFLPPAERQHINFDDPDSIDLIRFCEDLYQLKQGQTILKPMYDFQIHTRYAGGSVLVPAEIIIAEGSMLFLNESIRNIFNLRIFIDTPADIRLRRRLERDVRERGSTLAGAIDHYMASVLPIHDRFIEPAKHFSNLIIPGWEDSELALSDLASLIWRSLKKDERTYLSHSDPRVQEQELRSSLMVKNLTSQNDISESDSHF